MPQHSTWESSIPTGGHRSMTVEQLRELLVDIPGHHRVLVDGRPAFGFTQTTIGGDNGGSAVNVMSGAFET